MTNNDDEIRFLADSMLGSLAKWLRFFGYDTEYYSDIEDNRLLEIAASGNYVLLTSDRELHARAKSRKINTILVPLRSLKDQLVTINKKLGIRYNLKPRVPRCVYCNSILTKPKNLPEYLKNKNDVFFCPNCKKYFWEGRMWRNIRKFYTELENMIKSQGNTDRKPTSFSRESMPETPKGDKNDDKS